MWRRRRGCDPARMVTLWGFGAAVAALAVVLTVRRRRQR